MTEQITTPEALDALPVDTVIRLRSRLVADRHATGPDGWSIGGYFGPQGIHPHDLPATVLHRPDATAQAADVERLRELLAGAANVIESVRNLLVDRHQLYQQAVAGGSLPSGYPELIRIDEVMAVLVAGASVGLNEPPTVTS